MKKLCLYGESTLGNIRGLEWSWCSWGVVSVLRPAAGSETGFARPVSRIAEAPSSPAITLHMQGGFQTSSTEPWCLPGGSGRGQGRFLAWSIPPELLHLYLLGFLQKFHLLKRHWGTPGLLCALGLTSQRMECVFISPSAGETLPSTALKILLVLRKYFWISV